MMNLNKAPVAVTDRRRTRVGAQVTVGGKIGKARSALAPATSRVNAFVTGFTGKKVF